MTQSHHQNGIWDEDAAHWYATQYGDHPTTRMPIDAVDWQPGEAVVDIGCGTGSSLRHLSSYCPKGRLIGVEPTPAMLAIARQQTRQAQLAERIEFYPAAAEALPLDDASMDSVLAFNSYHHWRDRVLGLDEVFRVLKPGGRLLLSEEPEVLVRADLALSQIQQQLQNAGFMDLSRQRLTQGKVVCELIVARKPVAVER